MQVWRTYAKKGDWLKAAKLAVLDQSAPSGLATTFALIAVAERLDQPGTEEKV